MNMSRLSILFLLGLTLSVSGFNIDLNTHVEYSRPAQTLFGFSVASHKEGKTGWVIAGAPEDESEQARVGIEKAGAVYRCQTEMPYSCDQIPFDTSGNNNASGSMIDDKSRQWFGASVHSSDGIIVACAPRYVYFSINKRRREPVGTCFTATDSFSKFSEYSPCRTDSWGYHKQGYCQAGFATVVSKDRLYIGAVGSWYWQGQVFSQNLRNRLDLTSSTEGPDTEDNNYLGYSLAIGDFTGTGSADLAVGMPRSANLTGKVVLLTGRRLLHLHNLTGSQVGAYFGHSVAVLDANGDGLDDIAIGAPLHSSPMAQYETGRVYVVYQNQAHRFRQWTILDGQTVGGRFGLALAKLGDLDQDGYDDLAIGAPYNAKGGSVFIFRGGPNGIDDTPSQLITGKDVDPRLRGFGYSLSGSVDLDGNHYPDLLVGAPDSGQTVYFRSRPVVRVDANVILEVANGQIDPENRTCSLVSGTLVACLTVKGCLLYEGDAVDEQLEFLVTFKLDTKKAMPRMFFLTEEGSHEQSQVLFLQKNKMLCKRSYIYLLPNIRDKLSPLEVQMTYDLNPSTTRNQVEESKEKELRPIIDPRQNLRALTDAASIHKDCGLDNICIPDLKVSYNLSSEQYLIGSEQRLELSMNISNQGEDAYEATLFVKLPPNVSYTKTEMLTATPTELTSVLCSPPTPENDFVLKCDLGNPMLGFSSISLRTVLQPTINDGNATPISIEINVNSSNPELTTSLEDNADHLTIPVIVETDIVIRGLSDPDPLRHNASAYDTTSLDITHESEIGPEVTHVYQIENKGPSDILEAQVYILWPSYRPNDDPLLYLTSQPTVDGMGKCEFVSDVNPYQVTIDRYQYRSASYSGTIDYRQKRSYRTNEMSVDSLNDNEIQQATQTKKDSEELLSELDCGPTRCTYISCVVGPLKKRQSVVFRMHSRLWSTTVARLAHHEYEISSRLVARISKLPHNVDPGYLGISAFTVTSRVISVGGDYLDGGSIPIWILLLAVLAGLLFLALLSFILWHFGFFRRKRHQQDQHYGNGNGVITGARISSLDDDLFVQEGTLQEKQPLAATATISNNFHRHSRLSSSYPHTLQPGDEVL